MENNRSYFLAYLNKNPFFLVKSIDEEDWEESILTSKVRTSVTALFGTVSSLTSEDNRNVHASHKLSRGHSLPMPAHLDEFPTS